MGGSEDFIHKFVPGTSGRTLILLHGTGGTESDLLELGHTLDPDAGLLSPRGRILENGMPRSFGELPRAFSTRRTSFIERMSWPTSSNSLPAVTTSSKVNRLRSDIPTEQT